MSFVYDASQLPGAKEDARPVQMWGPEVSASEWNRLVQAVEDLRAGLISGEYFGLVSTPGTAVSAAGAARFRVAGTRLQASVNGGQYQSLHATHNVLDYGADPTGVEDSYAAFADAIAAAPTGGRVRVPVGTYALSAPLDVQKSLALEGDMPQWYGAASCVLRWPAGVDGIRVLPTAQRAVVRRLCLWATGKSSTAIGLRVNATVEISGLYVSGWATSGIVVDTTTEGGGGNANCSRFATCAVDGSGSDGVRVTGSDSNACSFEMCSSRCNGGWGFHDTSLTSGVYLQCHTEANAGGSYRLANSGPGGLVLNCYAEGDQPVDQVNPPAVVVGGTWGSQRTIDASMKVSRADPELGLKIGGGGGAQGALLRLGNLAFVDAGTPLTVSQAKLLPYTTTGPLVAAVDNTATPAFTGTWTQGHEFEVYNNTLYAVTYHDDADLPGTKLLLATPRATLSSGDSLHFRVEGLYCVEVGRRQARAYADTSGIPGPATTAAHQGRAAVASGTSSVTITTLHVLGSAAVRASHVVVTWEDNPGGQHWVTIPIGGGSFTVHLPAAAETNAKFRWRIED